MPASLAELRRARRRLLLVFASFVPGRVNRRHDNRVILRGSHVSRRLPPIASAAAGIEIAASCDGNSSHSCSTIRPRRGRRGEFC
jgi:hypothetical protein